MTDQPTPETDTRFIPPAARNLPPGVLDSATEGADRLDAAARTPVGRNFLAHALAQLARDGWLRTAPGDGTADEQLRDQLAARDAALAAYTAQLVHDQQRLARVRRLADQWQAATRPGERHPAAAAIHRALEDDDDGPSVAECAADDEAHWTAKYAGEGS